MRINLKKYLFIGATKDKARFFKEAQKFGALEFIHPSAKRMPPDPVPVQRLSQAIKTLQGMGRPHQEMPKSLIEAEAIAEKVLDLKQTIEEKSERRRVLKQELERLRPFGYFSFEEIKEIEEETGLRFRFFVAKSTKHFADIDPNLILVNSQDGIDYFISLSNAPIRYSDLVELFFTQSLADLKAELNETNKIIDKAHNELKTFTRYNTFLHKALISRINEANLLFATECSELELENTLFFVEGWVPTNQIDAMQTLCQTLNIYSEQVSLDEHETEPTYLENSGINRVGEDLVRIFDMPSNKDKDPSLWVLFAFSLFFSMIVFDAGYGLIFLFVAMYLHLKIKSPTKVTKRFVALLATLAISCTLWGGLTHSIFGMTLSPENPLRKHSLMTWLIEKKASYHMAKNDAVYKDFVSKYSELKNVQSPDMFVHLYVETEGVPYPVSVKLTDNVLMELALFVGSLHLILGLIRYLGYNPINIGWIAFICGGYLYIPYYLKATSLLYYVFGIDPQLGAEFGLHLVYAGVGLAALIGLIQHGIKGLFECMHVIQVFGDVLSYLRIYALGTAAYIVAETVNHMAAKVPLFFAILLLVLGHTINILLSIMGGTIHGLRLNFLEWYRYSFYGGGKDFQPLRLQTLE